MFFEILLMQIKLDLLLPELESLDQKDAFWRLILWMIINVLKPTYTSNVIVASANGRLSSWPMIKSLGGSEIDSSALLEKREPQPRHFFIRLFSSCLGTRLGSDTKTKSLRCYTQKMRLTTPYHFLFLVSGFVFLFY